MEDEHGHTTRRDKWWMTSGKCKNSVMTVQWPKMRRGGVVMEAQGVLEAQVVREAQARQQQRHSSKGREVTTPTCTERQEGTLTSAYSACSSE